MYQTLIIIFIITFVMSSKKHKLVLCHLFYEDLAFKIVKKLESLNEENTFFLFNLGGTLHSNAPLIKTINDSLLNKIILQVPNAGRDIGAKLRLFQVAESLKINHDYTLILHDKKSPHIKDGEKWGDELLKIIEPDYLNQIFSTFEQQKNVGIVCSSNYIQNEYSKDTKSFLCTSNNIIKSVLHTYHIKTSNYDFVAGNIFWVRSQLLRQFFGSKLSTDKIIASLEKGGNIVDFSKGTNVHAWERIMCWIATSQGYSIYGI